MPVVTAVSTAMPQTVEIHGRPMLTSIVRSPHPGPLMFEATGPVGNRTAVHTEHVLATVAENYDYWTAQLGIERAAWPPSFWGENLTLSGLDENTLRVGDRLKIGASAEFEVTSPRIPCQKLSWRLGQPDSFLRTLTDTGRTGFYLRVLKPGAIAAGDGVTLESPFPENIIVGDLSRLLNDFTADVTVLRRALNTPGLGHQASSMLRHRLTQMTDGARCKLGRWPGWRTFVVQATAQETAGVRSIILRPADGEGLAEYQAGQFLTVRLRFGDDDTITRVWSVSDYDEGGGTYRLTVRRTPQGRGSAHVHERLEVGDSLELRTPAGAFALDRSTVFRVTLISAGIGVTPLLSMLKAHARREDPSPLLWVHVTRNGDSHIFREEAEKALASHANFRSHIVYTQPRAADQRGIDYDAGGRPDAARWVRLLGETYGCSPFGRNIELPSQAGLFYICGPDAFERSTREALLAFGVDPGAIHAERFGRVAGTEVSVPSCVVRFARSGKTAVWESHLDLSLLEFAELQGFAPPSGCRTGICRSCETGILDGAVSYNPRPTAPLEPGRVLLCCARPNCATLDLDL